MTHEVDVVAAVKIYVGDSLQTTIDSSHGNFRQARGDLDTSAAWSHTFELGALGAGVHSVEAWAVDDNGNETLLSGASSVTVISNRAPFGNLESSTDSLKASENMVLVGWAADDDTGAPVAALKVYIDGVYKSDVAWNEVSSNRSDVVAAHGNRSDFLPSGWSITFNIGSLAAGQHTIAVSAVDDRDAEGQLGTSAGAETFTILPGPPTITTSPTAVVANLSGTTSFSVTATSTGSTTYRWYFNNSAMNDGGNWTGTTSATLSGTNLQTSNAGSYHVVVTNTDGGNTATAISSPATLKFYQSALLGFDMRVALGNSWAPAAVNPSLAGSGSGSLQYVVVGATGYISVSTPWSPPTAGLKYFYLQKLGDSAYVDNVASNPATANNPIPGSNPPLNGYYTLYVDETPAVTSPTAQSVTAGGTALFSSSASVTISTGSISFQWQKDNVNLTGATNSTLTISNVTAADAGNYRVRVINGVVTTYSGSAALTVAPALAITQQPQNQPNIRLNQSASFSVTATGTGLSYQWRKGTVAISAATNSTFTILHVKAADAGSYNVLVSDSAGASLLSNSASLSVIGGDTTSDAYLIHHVDYLDGDSVTESQSLAIRAGPAVNVYSGATVVYNSSVTGGSVRLLAGFRAVAGSRFRAYVSAGSPPPPTPPPINDPSDPTLIAGWLADSDGDGLYAAAEANTPGRSDDVREAPVAADAAGIRAAWTTLLAAATNENAVGVTSGQLSVGPSGVATYSIPLWVSPGTAGMEPKLSLGYSSQAGSGLAGFGWSLGGLTAISRGPKTRAVDAVNRAVDFTDEDQFYLDGQRLILISGTHGYDGAEYRTELDSFTRVVCYGRAGNGPARFRSWTKAGLVIDYGYDYATDAVPNKASFRPDNQSEVMTWAASRIYDTKGNYIAFEYYNNEGGSSSSDWDQRIKQIDYTGHTSGSAPYASVVFNYDNREDWRVSYMAGRRIANGKRLSSILSNVQGAVAREYVLHYLQRETPSVPRSLLAEFEEIGAPGAEGKRRSLPRLTFTYEAPTAGWTQLAAGFAPPVMLAQDGLKPRGTGFVDLSGDGRPDFVQYHRWSNDGNGTDTDAQPRGWINSATGWQPMPNATASPAIPDWRPSGAFVLAWDERADSGTRMIDLDGDGRADLFHAYKNIGDGVDAYVYRNTTAGWADVSSTWGAALSANSAYISSHGDTDASSRVLDINGDGRPDLIWNYRNQTKGAMLNTGAGWTSAPLLAPPFPIKPGTFFLDLNGDGLPDQTVHWYGGDKAVIGVALNGPAGWTTNLTGQPIQVGGSASYASKQASLGPLGLYLPPQILTVNATHDPIGTEFVDLNGDGLVDLVSAGYDGAAPRGAYLNTGRGWTLAPEFTPPAGVYLRGTAGNKPHEASGVSFLDVNADGLVDLVVARQGATFSVYFGTGNGWSVDPAPVAFNLPEALALQAGTDPLISKPAGLDFIDIDGDGTVDLVKSLGPGDSNGKAWRNNSRASDRLSRVSTGLGVGATLAYKPLTDPTVYTKGTDFSGIAASEVTAAKVANVIGPMFVISSVSHDDGLGGQYRVDYTYNALRSHLERGSLGFESTETTDSRTGIVSVTEYSQNWPTIGMPLESTTRVATRPVSEFLSRSIISYAEKSLNSGKTRLVFAKQTDSESHDLDNSLVSLSTTWSYDYAGGATPASGYDIHGNSLFIRVTSGQGDDLVTKTTVSTYYDTASNYAGITTSPSDGAYTPGSTKWFLGRLERSTVTSTRPVPAGTFAVTIPGSITRTSSFTYTTDTGLLETETVEPDLAANSPLRISTAYVYDQWGNKTLVTTTGMGLAGNNAAVGTRTTEWSYEATDVDAPFSGRFPAWTRNALGHAEAYGYDHTLGVATRLTGPNALATTWAYDGFGRKIQEDRPDPRGATGASEASRTTMRYGWTSSTGTSGDRPRALYFIETTPAGAAPSVAFYDAVGRSVAGYTIAGGKRAGSGATYRILGNQSRYDNFGRTHRTSLPFFLGESALLASAVRSYDALGRPTLTTTSADGVGAGPTPELVSLDATDSDLASASVSYVTTTYAYAGLVNSVTTRRVRGALPSVGIANAEDLAITSSSTRNLQGWVVSTVRNTAAAEGADDRAATAFLHDPLGQLSVTQVRHTSGWVNTTQLAYDARGRKSQMVDLSMGTWSYAYNSAGELITQTDPRARTTTLGYDRLGRLVLRTEPAMSSTDQITGGTLTTTWIYDTSPHPGAAAFPTTVGLGYTTPTTWVGKLHTVATSADRFSRAYAEGYTYDASGRSSSVARTIAGVTRTTSQYYDETYGRPTVTIYPGAGAQAGYATRTDYDAEFGFAVAVRDARDEPGLALQTGFRNEISPRFIYWQAEEWDAYGLRDSTLGNGLYHSLTRSTATGRTLHVYSGNGSYTRADVQSLYYSYDSLGNVAYRKDEAPDAARTESFDYDPLDRLVTSRVYSSVLGTVPTGTVTTAYDPLGNLRSKSDNGGTYTYGDSAHPYRVSAAGGRSYSYDALGNITTDGSRQFYYAASGHMQRIVSGGNQTEFWFGAGHERVIQEKTINGLRTATVYLGALTELTVPVNADNSFGAATEVRYYVVTPLGRTAVRTETPGSAKIETRWLHQDTLGSVTAVTNEWGQAERRYAYDAWGKQTLAVQNNPGTANPGPTLAVAPTRGYTDHETLGDFGLIHMNGRVYDPVLGRFLSADPFVDDAGDGQSYNRYSYVSNNPLNHTDPSGYFKLGDAAKIAAIAVAAFVTAGAALYAYAAMTGMTFVGGFAGALASVGTAAGWSGGYAIAVGVGAGFGSSFAGSLLNGGSVGDAFKAGVIGGAIGGVSAYVGYQVRQGLYDARQGFEDWQSGRLSFYDVAGPDPSDPTKMLMRPISQSQISGNVTIFENGILNDAERGAYLGWNHTGGRPFILAHNPTHGLIADTVETGLGKLTGTSSTGRHLAEVLKQINSSGSSLYLHSQGAQIGMNALQQVASEGLNLTGLKVYGYGGATNLLTSRAIVRSVGANWAGWTMNPFDAVPNIVGMNALYAPHRFLTSLIGTPLLFSTNSYWSAHTLRSGSFWTRFSVTY